LRQEANTSVSREDFSWKTVGDEAVVVSQVIGSVSRQRRVDEGGDLDALLHWKPENWWDAVASPSARH